MVILRGNDIFNRLKYYVDNTKENMLFLTAFCKRDALKILISNTESIKDKILIVRFQYNDIISGASDLDIYNICKKNGWRLFFKLDLHAKTYVFDKKYCMIGSSNITQSGLEIALKSNDEMMTQDELSLSDYQKIEAVVYDSVEITEELYREMKLLCKTQVDNHISGGWGNEITNLFVKKIRTLFTCDLPQEKYLKGISEKNDILFLRQNESCYSSIKELFIHYRVYRWLRDRLEEKETREMYFGELSAELHNCLIEEPKPYRKDVKILLSNLLDWTEKFSEEIIIDVPNHSTRVKLKR